MYTDASDLAIALADAELADAAEIALSFVGTPDNLATGELCELCRVVSRALSGAENLAEALAGLGDDQGDYVEAIAAAIVAKIEGATMNSTAASGPLVRCINVYKLTSALDKGVSKPAKLLGDKARRLIAMLGGLRSAWQDARDGKSGADARAKALVPRVRDAVDGMMDEEQRAKQLAVTARELAPPVGRLAGRARRKDGGFDLMATACSFSKGIDTVAALGRNAIRSRRMAPPIQTVLTYVKKFREVVDVANSTANDPAFARDLVASQVEAFLEKLAAHPLGFIQEAADKMRELSDVLFDRLGGYVEQLADFCAKQIQPVIYKIVSYLVSLADRIESKFQIEDALTNVTKWLDEKTDSAAFRTLRQFVEIAQFVVQFLEEGKVKEYATKVFDVAAILVQPGALVNKVVQPALDFVEKITDMDGIGAVFNETFGQLLEFGEDWVKDKLGDLQEYAEEFIGAMVEKAVSFADGLIDEIAAKAGQLGANILDELMPTWLPPLLSDILTYVDMIQGTLESIYDIVNGTTTDGILHFLELPMKMVKATCPADEVAELYGSADADEQIEAAGARRRRRRLGAAAAPASAGSRRPLFARFPAAEARAARGAGPAVKQGGWQSSEAVGGWPTCVRERGGAAAARVARE